LVFDLDAGLDLVLCGHAVLLRYHVRCQRARRAIDLKGWRGEGVGVEGWRGGGARAVGGRVTGVGGGEGEGEGVKG
jgi:hypothetical protein